MNRFVKDSIKKIQSKYRKIHRKARDLGLSLPIALLIFLTFFSIITVAVIQTRRDTTLTRASGVCGTETPACVYGSYMEPAGAEQICPGAWRKCRVSSTCKYECLDQNGAGGGNEGTGGTYNYPNCSGYNTAVKSTCEKEFGNGNCTKCTNDGKSVRWHQGTETSTKPETQKCEKTSCKQEDPETYTSGGLIYYGANNLYYSNLSLCQKKDKSGKTLSKMCDLGTKPKTSVSPVVSQENECEQTSCAAENKTYEIKWIQQKIIYKNSSQLFSDSSCKSPLDFKTECVSNTPLVTEKRLCINTSCGLSFKDLPNVDYHKPLERYGDEYYLPGCETRLVNPQNYCVKGGSIIGPQRFVYPQTAYEPMVSGWQTANTGEQIDCNNNFCIQL